MGHDLKALDDGIVAVLGLQWAFHESELIKGDLNKAGLVFSVKKSVWELFHIIN